MSSTSFDWVDRRYSVTVEDGVEEDRFSINATLFDSVNAQKKKKIGSIKMFLLQRPSPYFFELADESAELIDLARMFCDSKGIASRIQHPKMTPDAVNGGGFLTLYTVEIDPDYQQQDLGLRFIHQVLVQLRGQWTLATLLPGSLSHKLCEWKANARVLLHQNNLTDDQLERLDQSVTRHLARLGFVQAVQTDAWFLTASTYFATPNPVAAWLSKQETASITIQKKPKLVQPSGLDMELTKEILALDNEAMMEGTAIQRMEELVRQGANVNKSGSWQKAAANKKDPRVFEILVQLGGDVNNQDVLGNSALHVAACQMKADNVRWLARHGANTSARNSDGKTPLQCLLDAESSSSDFQATFGLGSLPVREIDIAPKLACFSILMPPQQQALLVDGWMSPRMKEMLLTTAELEMDGILTDCEVSFIPRQPTPLSECVGGYPEINRINYIPTNVLTRHNPDGLYESFKDGWGYCFLAAGALLRRGQTPTVRAVEQCIRSNYSIDQRKFQHFISHHGKVEYAIDALINITRNVAVDGDDGWEYCSFEDEIEAHPATPLDRAFDVVRFKCINQGGGEGSSRGPYRYQFDEEMDTADY